MTRASVRSDRIAYQIWALIQRTGGDCTVHDMAEATGETWQRCVNICRQRGWSGQYRVVSHVHFDHLMGASATSVMDAELATLEVRA